MVKFLKRCFLVFIIAFFVAVPLKTYAVSQEDSEVIYVAGNPSLYPIEYYDEKEEVYKGVMPLLYEEISKETGIKFEYIHPSKKDNRLYLAENKQAEIISGWTEDEIPNGLTASEKAFSFEFKGEDTSVCILFTEIAKQDFKNIVNDAIKNMDYNKRSYLTLTAASQRLPVYYTKIIIIILIIAVIFLILSLIGAVIYHYLYKKKYEDYYLKDTVTGLGNQLYFEKYFRQFIHDKNRALYYVICISINCDRIRKYSDNSEVENALKYTASILNSYIKDTDILAKIGENRFYIAKLTVGQDELIQWLNSVFYNLNEYKNIQNRDFELNPRAGIYKMDLKDHNPENTILYSQLANEKAEKNKVEYMFSDDKMLKEAQSERQVIMQAEKALSQHQFVLFLHPFVEAKREQIIGGEALIRWQHPTQGLIFPSQFIEVMERENMISELDYYMLDMVCGFLKELKNEGKNEFKISVNFSRITLNDENFVKRVSSIISKYDIDKENLLAEITESILAKGKEKGIENVKWLRSQGISIALDDFGSGYTSFADMSNYPIDYIKIDKSILDNAENEKSRAILAGLIKFGHELKIEVLCEGVETRQQAEMLRKMHCDMIQGYYYYRAMSSEMTKNLLEKQLTKKN